MDTVITGKRNNPAKGVNWQSASETLLHTVTHGRGTEGETGEWSG